MTREQTAATLWVLFALFCGRVVGQALVAFFDVQFLPPMEAWYSGLLPYPYLLPAQVLIIALLVKIGIEFGRRRGTFGAPRPGLVRGALVFGWLYLAAMVARYVVRMTLYPDQRWFGGSIPIVFHWILATYVILWARSQRAQARPSP